VTKGTTRSVRRIDAPRHEVYRALLDASAVATWRVPRGMTCHVHEFDAREGGSFRVSLTYDAATAVGKTSAHTDTYHGRFVRLVRDELVIEVVEFETANPDLLGQMTITTTLSDVDNETLVVVVHEGLPPGVSNEDNEAGTKMALDNLAALIEDR
jgi:uncharacterized protein YndB with AHSA1/START domain